MHPSHHFIITCTEEGEGVNVVNETKFQTLWGREHSFLVAGENRVRVQSFTCLLTTGQLRRSEKWSSSFDQTTKESNLDIVKYKV